MNATAARATSVALLLALSFGLGPAAAAGDPAKDVKDKDWQVRLAAVEALEAAGGKDAEALLLGALKDKDWEVVERAAVALERRGGPASLQDLVSLAAEGPIRRIRIAAARAAGHVDAVKAIVDLGRKINGDYAVNALEAIGEIAETAQSEETAKIVDEALKVSKRHEMDRVSGAVRDRDPVRRAAASSLTAFPVAERVTRIEKLMFDADVAVACAALDTVVEVPDVAFLPAFVAGLGAKKIDDCVVRRLHNGIRAIVALKPAEAVTVAAPVLSAVGTAGTPEATARFVRVVGDLGKAPPPPAPDASDKSKPTGPLIPADKAVEALAPAVKDADPAPRAAAAVALGKIRSDAALAQVMELAEKDADAHVRVVAVRALAGTLTAKDGKAFKVFLERLSDADPLVREEAAVALGVKGLKGAIPSLDKLVDEALAEKPSRDRKHPAMKWAIGTAALVSMGKTQDPDAVEPLRKALHDAQDWRLRASAVVGLGRLQKNVAVNDLIDALDDKDPNVHNCAFEFLRRMSSVDVEPTSGEWRKWWAKNEKGYEFVDREEQDRKFKKYGYAPTIEGLYEGLDVVVLSTRKGGDRIEDLLDVLKIKHRNCLAPNVAEAGLHPFALFVANCPGEIGEKDAEALSWFVRSGGYLFGSCWALHETIEKIYPGTMKRFLTPTAQVIDYNATAQACVPDSVYLEDVFDSWARPMYVLEGAHLLEVLDRDRVEVLIDSPCSATSWGCGNMAGWTTAGHGLILDSVNHFNHQGFHFATGLKTPEDRMAYAMEHMGTTYADLRDFSSKKVFDKSSTCERDVTDRSAFRFISNFVRYKRRVDR